MSATTRSRSYSAGSRIRSLLATNCFLEMHRPDWSEEPPVGSGNPWPVEDTLATARLGLHHVAALLAGTAARGAGAVIGFLDFATWLGHDKLLEAD